MALVIISPSEHDILEAYKEQNSKGCIGAHK